MWTDVLVKYLHIASTQMNDLFEYVAQTPPTPEITGKFTFSFSFLLFICTEGRFGLRP